MLKQGPDHKQFKFFSFTFYLKTLVLTKHVQSKPYSL
jgi:hypothetical protein